MRQFLQLTQYPPSPPLTAHRAHSCCAGSCCADCRCRCGNDLATDQAPSAQAVNQPSNLSPSYNASSSMSVDSLSERMSMLLPEARPSSGGHNIAHQPEPSRNLFYAPSLNALNSNASPESNRQMADNRVQIYVDDMVNNRVQQGLIIPADNLFMNMDDSMIFHIDDLNDSAQAQRGTSESSRSMLGSWHSSFDYTHSLSGLLPEIGSHFQNATHGP